MTTLQKKGIPTQEYFSISYSIPLQTTAKTEIFFRLIRIGVSHWIKFEDVPGLM